MAGFGLEPAAADSAADWLTPWNHGRTVVPTERSTLSMQSIRMKFALVIALVAMTFWAPSSVRVVAQAPVLSMASIASLTFSPDGTLFAADNQNAAIVALDLGAQAGAA